MSKLKLIFWDVQHGNACNRLLNKSPVTQESVNLVEMAHICSFSKAGPRSTSLRLRLPKHSCDDHTKPEHAPSQNRN